MQACSRFHGFHAVAVALFAGLAAVAHSAAGQSLRLHPVSLSAVDDAPRDRAANEAVDPIASPQGRVRIEPLVGIWTPRAGGRIRLSPNKNERIELGPGLRLDDKELTPNLEIRFRPQSDWEFTLGGFEFKTKARGAFAGPDAMFGSIPLVRGEPFNSSLSLASAHLDVSWRGWWHRIHDRERDVGEADFGIYPTLGLRWMRVRHDVARDGFGQEKTGGDWGAVTIGAHMRLHWSPEDGLPVGQGIGIEIGTGIGPAFGNGSGFTWHVRSGVRFELFRNVDVMIAYRLLEMDVRNRSDDYRFTGGLQGMFFSVGVRF